MARMKYPGVDKISVKSQSPKKRLVLKVQRKKHKNTKSTNLGAKQVISRKDFEKIFGDSDEEVRVSQHLMSFFVV